MKRAARSHGIVGRATKTMALAVALLPLSALPAMAAEGDQSAAAYEPIKVSETQVSGSGTYTSDQDRPTVSIHLCVEYFSGSTWNSVYCEQKSASNTTSVSHAITTNRCIDGTHYYRVTTLGWAVTQKGVRIRQATAASPMVSISCHDPAYYATATYPQLLTNSTQWRMLGYGEYRTRVPHSRISIKVCVQPASQFAEDWWGGYCGTSSATNAQTVSHTLDRYCKEGTYRYRVLVRGWVESSSGQTSVRNFTGPDSTFTCPSDGKGYQATAETPRWASGSTTRITGAGKYVTPRTHSEVRLKICVDSMANGSSTWETGPCSEKVVRQTSSVTHSLTRSCRSGSYWYRVRATGWYMSSGSKKYIRPATSNADLFHC